MFQYALQVIDTGETVVSEYSDRSMVSWHKKMCKKVLKDKRRTAQVKEAITNNEVIVALLNYEELADYTKALKGYDNFFESLRETNREGSNA